MAPDHDCTTRDCIKVSLPRKPQYMLDSGKIKSPQFSPMPHIRGPIDRVLHLGEYPFLSLVHTLTESLRPSSQHLVGLEEERWGKRQTQGLGSF